MLKTRIKRLAAENARAVTLMAQVTASIAALKDEDLLDFADIFLSEAPSPLRDMASAEMGKRGLSL